MSKSVSTVYVTPSPPTATLPSLPSAPANTLPDIETPPTVTPYSISSSTTSSVTTTSSILATSTISSGSSVDIVSSTQSSATNTASVTSISSGSAVTTSSPATARVSAAQATATATSHGTHLSQSHKDITIATTVVGGVLFFIILIYILLWRRNGSSMSQIMRLKRRSLSTVKSSPHHYDGSITALPIYKEQRYSVRSSRISAFFGARKGSRHASMLAPDGTIPAHPRTAKRLHAQNKYFQHSWKPMESSLPMEMSTNNGSIADVTTSPLIRHDTKKSKRSMDMKPSSPLTHSSPLTQQALESVSKPAASFSISVREELPEDEEMGLGLRDADDDGAPINPQERWSWTNSQAPATPRLYAPNRRSSLSSLPRFRGVKSWVQGQHDRNPRISEEEKRPMTAQGMLKNKASLPTLRPPPAVRRKQSGKQVGQATRSQSLSSVLRRRPSGQPRSPPWKSPVVQSR